MDMNSELTDTTHLISFAEISESVLSLGIIFVLIRMQLFR